MCRYNIAVVFAFILLDVAAGQKDCRPKDCYYLKCYRVSKAKDGPHTIYPSKPGLSSLQVSCDQETDGGGWIMYQRRVDGTVNFTKNWVAYKDMFGNHGDNTTELWLGNENVYQLLQSYGSTQWEMRIEVDAFDGSGCWVVASNFRMNNEAHRYSMNWDSVSASKDELVGDLNYHKLIPFITLDNNEGSDDAKQCINEYKGGWWYVKCVMVFLNGEYEKQPVATFKSISFDRCKYRVALQRSRMMFRPQNDVRPCNNPCKNGGACEYNGATKSATCRCTAKFNGPTCEAIHKNVHNDTDTDAKSNADIDAESDGDNGTVTDAVTDADSDAVTDADSDAVTDSDSDAVTDAYSDAVTDADSDAVTDAYSDAVTDADSDADSDVVSDADSDVVSDADSDADSDTDSESGNDLLAIIGGVLLLLILIAGAIIFGLVRRRKQREAEEDARRVRKRELAERERQLVEQERELAEREKDEEEGG